MKTILPALCLFLLSCGTGFAGENPGSQKKEIDVNASKSAPCVPGIAQTDLDIGNVRATMLTDGDVWWALTLGGYEVPKGSGKMSIIGGAMWMGGIDQSGQIKVAAQTFGQTGNDFWPGPIDVIIGASDTLCTAFDRHWKVSRAEVIDFVQNGTTTPDILSWPGQGNSILNPAQDLAPFFDVNGDGLYDPLSGDYPFFDLLNTGTNCCNTLQGDQALWWVFNDVGGIHASGTPPIGIEVQAQAFAYNSGMTDIDNATFYQYKIINRSNVALNQCYFGWFTDPDLGNPIDDFAGCDVGRSLAYCYNGDQDDEGPIGYGLNPPAIGVDILRGPLADPGDGIDNNRNGITDEPGEDILMSSFICYNNVNNSPTGNPNGFFDYLSYLRGKWLDGMPITYGGDGRNPSNPVCNFMFPDDTDSALNASNGAWSEIIAGNVPEDRRFIQSAGPYTLLPGQVDCISIGVPWARDTSGVLPPSLTKLKQADDAIQLLFDNCFVITGIANLDADPFQVKISPVPFHDETTVSFNNKKGNLFTLIVYDINGREVRKIKNLSGNSVTVKRLGMEDGIYIFYLSDDKEKSYSQKVVIE